MVSEEITIIRKKINRKMILRTNLAGICYTLLLMVAAASEWWLATLPLAWLVYERLLDLRVHLEMRRLIDARVDFT